MKRVVAEEENALEEAREREFNADEDVIMKGGRSIVLE